MAKVPFYPSNYQYSPMQNKALIMIHSNYNASCISHTRLLQKKRRVKVSINVCMLTSSIAIKSSKALLIFQRI